MKYLSPHMFAHSRSSRSTRNSSTHAARFELRSPGTRWGAVVLGALFGAVTLACSSEDDGEEFMTGPMMLPGDNCRSCHGGPSTKYPNAPNWTIAGTVFDGPESDVGVSGVTVEVVDATGLSFEMTTNSVGNFYTPVEVESPYTVTLSKDGVSVSMPVPPPSGGCNACHNNPTVGGAPGRLYLPEDGSYESEAECDGEHTVTVGSTNYDCAPYVCAEDGGENGAFCLNTCESDDDCVEATCSDDALCVTP